jgi:hypothetical protein
MLRPVLFFHPLRNADVLRSMITTDTTRDAMGNDVLKKEIENGGGTIVVVGTNPGDKTGISINKSVDDDAPAAEACIPD